MPYNKTDSDYMVWYSIQLLQRTIESKHKAIFHNKNMPQFYGKDVNFLRLMMKKRENQKKRCDWHSLPYLDEDFTKHSSGGFCLGFCCCGGWFGQVLVGWLLDCLVGFSCIVSSCISTCHF